MHRIDAFGTVEVMPEFQEAGSISGYFSPGNPSTGTPATRISRDWLNATQEEIVGVIEAMGLTPTKGELGQLLAAIRLLTGIPINPAAVQTTDATVADLAAVAVAVGEVVMVEASVVGRKSDGSAFYAGKICGSFYRNPAGDVTLLAGAPLTDEVNDSGWGGIAMAAHAPSQSVKLTCEGLAGTTIDWQASVKVTRLTA